MSEDGTTLNDSHAEALARRALVCFLSEELERMAADPSFESRLLARANGQPPPQRCRLKPGVRLHLCVSEVPCGDASIFAVDAGAGAGDRASESVKKGGGGGGDSGGGGDGGGRVSFTGAKVASGGGGDGVAAGGRERGAQQVGVLRTKSARSSIDTAHRTMSMSCSDKIARWNVLGLQGGLLSQFLEPVYLSSVVVAVGKRRPIEELAAIARSVHRAVCGRFGPSGRDDSDPAPLAALPDLPALPAAGGFVYGRPNVVVLGVAFEAGRDEIPRAEGRVGHGGAVTSEACGGAASGVTNSAVSGRKSGSGKGNGENSEGTGFGCSAGSSSDGANGADGDVDDTSKRDGLLRSEGKGDDDEDENGNDHDGKRSSHADMNAAVFLNDASDVSICAVDMINDGCHKPPSSAGPSSGRPSSGGGRTSSTPLATNWVCSGNSGIGTAEITIAARGTKQVRWC